MLDVSTICMLEVSSYQISLGGQSVFPGETGAGVGRSVRCGS